MNKKAIHSRSVSELNSLFSFGAILILIACFLPGICYSQKGLPFITNYSPSDYSSTEYASSPQNWDVIRDMKGIVYVANSSGILVFDGESWTQVEGSKNLQLFKFGMDKSGRIFSGGAGDLGYIHADSIGKFYFHSLKKLLPDSARNFSKIFRVVSSENRIYFMDTRYLFCWTGAEFKVWKSASGFKRIFEASGKIFVVDKGGIFQIRNDILEPVCTTEEINTLEIRGIIPVENKGAGTPEFLIIANQKGLFLLKDNKLNQVNSGLSGIEIYNVSKLSENNYIMSTNGQGIISFGLDGKINRIINEQSGMQNSQALFPRTESGSVVWASLFKGLSRVELNEPLTFFDKHNHLEALTLSFHKTQSGFLAGTLEGGYFLKEDKNDNGASGFKALPATVGAVEDIIHFNDKIILGTEKGIYILSENLEVTPVLKDRVVNCMIRSRKNPDRVFFSQQNFTISSMIWINGKWEEEGVIAQLQHKANSLAENADGNLFATYDKIAFLDFNGGFNLHPRVIALDSTHGFTKEMGIVEVSNVNGRTVFGTEMGIYTFDKGRNKLTPDETFGKEFSNGKRIAYNLTETKNGDVWVTTNRQTGLLRKQPSGSFLYDSLPVIRAPITDVFSIYEDPEGIVWFGATEMLLRYDPSVAKNYHEPFYALVRKVKVNSDSILFYGNYADENGVTVPEQPESYVKTLPFSLNHLTFEFSAPFFEAPEKLEYSFMLEGQDAHWSRWGKATVAEYTNLREGNYKFMVKARNVYGTISKVGEYRFAILPPWSRTVWAYIAYFILAVALIVLIARLNSRRLIAAKHRLEAIVKLRTAEVVQQREEIRKEKDLSESLLLNILPAEIAAELKAKGTAEAKMIDEVTVLFTDFKGFTQIAEKLSPQELVAEIHECFSAFDRIMEKHGIEKIKTIGDAYMAAGGLPTPNKTHATDVVRAALEIQQFMHNHKAQKEKAGNPLFEIRIGMHTGPVVAGIVGIKKFAYDIWGDTVNTASRMESSGEAGKVNISGATYEKVKHQFKCTYRGKVQAKNKGEIDMYFVE